MFASQVLQFRLQALESLFVFHSFDWVLADELESWPKERLKPSRNYPIEGHANQYVEREQLEIYKEKKMRGEEMKRLQPIDDCQNSI